jgi:hypothetical protein
VEVGGDERYRGEGEDGKGTRGVGGGLKAGEG